MSFGHSDKSMEYLVWLVVKKPSLKMMEFVNGKDDIPFLSWKIKLMFETTNQ